ncbi:MAG: UDP-N-acetylglucosamine--N-acetylmuramyl-(pentapeptide) pyrophosphoryl-undecaprenol N-acetylglucosamine transferase [Erysipelotrichaceae bacterium]|nr:UDP-N-acetylglucosamine--N-acetylmuramyl-(pentapeptide) pyrophosphoryl-undecaprenol N-acetylglucosamine transferase [Erysipelotrichaceae bacterium]
MNVLLLSSSTGGHIYPCFELGKYLETKGINVTYLGFKGQMEEIILPNDKLITIDSKNSFKKVLSSPFEIIKLIKEINKLKNKKYDIYIGFGGFITTLSLFLKKDKPLLIHEQNIILGDSNKLCRKYSNKVLYSFECDDNKGILVGNPSGDKIKQKEFIYKNKFNVLFIFGSLGSSSLIEKLMIIDNKLDDKHSYTLVIGSKLFSRFKNKFNKIKVKEFIDLRNEIDNYDIVFSRGGASTLYEVIQSNTYCISIPSPYVKNNHQEKNVDYLVNKNLVSKIKEKDFSLITISNHINSFIDFDFALSRYKSMSKFKINNSRELIYQEIIKNVKN